MARRAIASLVVFGLASIALAVTLSLPTDLAAASANEALAGRIVGALKGEQPTVIIT